jgi:hypothetical protein
MNDAIKSIVVVTLLAMVGASAVAITDKVVRTSAPNATGEQTSLPTHSFQIDSLQHNSGAGLPAREPQAREHAY